MRWARWTIGDREGQGTKGFEGGERAVRICHSPKNVSTEVHTEVAGEGSVRLGLEHGCGRSRVGRGKCHSRSSGHSVREITVKYYKDWR